MFLNRKHIYVTDYVIIANQYDKQRQRSHAKSSMFKVLRRRK